MPEKSKYLPELIVAGVKMPGAKTVGSKNDYSVVITTSVSAQEHLAVYEGKSPFFHEVEYNTNSTRWSQRTTGGSFRSDSPAFPNEITFSRSKDGSLKFMNLLYEPTSEWKAFIKSVLPAIEFVEKRDHLNIKRPEWLKKIVAEIKQEEAARLGEQKESLLRTVGENILYFIKDVHNSVSIGIRKG
jgi:hypothetical protein